VWVAAQTEFGFHQILSGFHESILRPHDVENGSRLVALWVLVRHALDKRSRKKISLPARKMAYGLSPVAYSGDVNRAFRRSE
jgi:hypothetical protein